MKLKKRMKKKLEIVDQEDVINKMEIDKKAINEMEVE